MKWIKVLIQLLTLKLFPKKIAPVIILTPVVITPVVTLSKSIAPLPDKNRAFFRHTKTRVAERYNLCLNQTVWEAWNNEICMKDSDALLLFRNDDSSTIWRVWFGNKAIVVVSRDGLVVTALRNEIRSKYYCVKRPEKAQKVSHLREKYDHVQKNYEFKSLPKLSQAIIRPRRNEAKLAKLKEAGNIRG